MRCAQCAALVWSGEEDAHAAAQHPAAAPIFATPENPTEIELPVEAIWRQAEALEEQLMEQARAAGVEHVKRAVRAFKGTYGGKESWDPGTIDAAKVFFRELRVTRPDLFSAQRKSLDRHAPDVTIEPNNQSTADR